MPHRHDKSEYTPGSAYADIGEGTKQNISIIGYKIPQVINTAHGRPIACILYHFIVIRRER